MTKLDSSTIAKTVVFAGGGTGGHLFPGIAVATELARSEPTTQIVFIGSEKPLEKQILGRTDWTHHALPSCSPSLRPARLISSLVSNVRAFCQAVSLLRTLRPQVVVGLGGFASVPPVLAARWLRIPIVLLEQNAVPGRATRWLSRIANVVCLPNESVAAKFSKSIKTVVTGNPLRREIVEMLRGPEESVIAHISGCVDGAPLVSTLLILGGSQGASSLNRFVLSAFSQLNSELDGWHIVHQTGETECDVVKQAYQSQQLSADVRSFIADMSGMYRSATLVISRAGATTLAEFACAGLPAILVPLPTAAHDHQTQNADLFVKHQAAVLVEQTSTSDALRVELARLLTDDQQRQSLRDAMRSLAKPHAARDVATIIQQTGRLSINS